MQRLERSAILILQPQLAPLYLLILDILILNAYLDLLRIQFHRINAITMRPKMITPDGLRLNSLNLWSTRIAALRFTIPTNSNTDIFGGIDTIK